MLKGQPGYLVDVQANRLSHFRFCVVVAAAARRWRTAGVAAPEPGVRD
jgi:hypothetical protein